MIRFGVIGTNWITDRMLEASMGLEYFAISAIYSRSMDRAKSFAAKYNVPYTYTDLESFASSPHIDAVYIASPNSLHCEQAIRCMNHGKHVLCEKPLAANRHEVQDMFETANSNKVILMEAMKSIWMPGFQTVKDHLPKIGKVRRYTSSFCQYSSRYDAYKQGTILNAFRPEFGNGSLMDLGVYCIYPAVVLFGKPSSIQASATMLESGVDGAGSLILNYPDMDACISYSKISSSGLATEIQGEEATMVIPKISEPSNISIRYHDGSVEYLSETEDDSEAAMRHEMKAFIHLVQTNHLQAMSDLHKYSRMTMEIMDEARQQFGLVYPNDHEYE